MKIYTTYFANVKNLPHEIVPVAISRGVPRWHSGMKRYLALAPTPDIFYNWCEFHNEDSYRFEYMQYLNSQLPRSEILGVLEAMSNGRDVALVCFERPGEFCHRHLVAEYIGNVHEWKKDDSKFRQLELF